MKRRSLLVAAGASLAGLSRRTSAQETVPDTLEGKRNLVLRTARPPNYESPLAALRSEITPNDQFFVSYHRAQVPDMAALQSWTLQIGGDAARKKVTMGLAELERLPATEVVAVCQCAGYRRAEFDPHVPGVQWGLGAVGNATWRGPLLRDVLTLAGVTTNAVEIAFSGVDPAQAGAEPFVKSLPVERALADDTIIATWMNDEKLPLWNGLPARLIVPGWTATYWMKHLAYIYILGAPLANKWMQSAYRVPADMFPFTPFPTQDTETTRPVTDILVNSLVTSHANGDRVAAGRLTLAGQAWDNGFGIATVEVSPDGGATWLPATLNSRSHRFGFHPWSVDLTMAAGPVALMVRATGRYGAVQPAKPLFNAGGYNNNAIQTIHLVAN